MGRKFSTRICSIEGCGRKHRTNGFCQKHYVDWKDTRPGHPCSIPDCGKPVRARGWCRLHYERWKFKGDPLKLLKRPAGEGTPDGAGYTVMYKNGKRTRKHRHIVEKIIGRPLEKKEHIHHKNGDKSDDSPENLQVVTPWKHRQLHAKFFRDERRKECRKCRKIKYREYFYLKPAKPILPGVRKFNEDPHRDICKLCSRKFAVDRWASE